MNDKEILANAPEGATFTCTICEDKQILYIDSLDMLVNGLATFWSVNEVEVKDFDAESRDTSFNNDLRSLADIKRIAELEDAMAIVKKISEYPPIDRAILKVAETVIK